MAKKVLRKPVRKALPKKINEKNGFMKFLDKVKWFIVELVKVYSNQPSYFSKKRIESGIGFIIAECGMIFFLIRRIDALDAYEFAVWASIQFFVAGYMVKQIQKQKEFENYEEEPYSIDYDDSYEEPIDYDNLSSENCECNCHKDEEQEYDSDVYDNSDEECSDNRINGGKNKPIKKTRR